jgi:serine O-acetyltransferase
VDIADNAITIDREADYRISDWAKLKYNWYADLYRYTGKPNKRAYFHALLRNNSYQYTFLMRLCSYLSQNKKNIFNKIAFRFFYEIFRHHSLKSCVEIFHYTKIGTGLYIPHIVGIVIHQDAIIGKNCHISQNTTIGQLNRGDRKGSPVIGDNVYIAPGAVIIGKISIGNNVVIGPNSVVTKDIPDNAVAAGIPARVISFRGSVDYINRTDY